MRIVIDMQGAQTESRFRGMGRYTLSLALAIARNRGEHEVILALNGLFPDTIESLRAAFDGVLPQQDIRVWDAPGPTRETNPDNRLRREVAERMREAFLAAQQPDVVLVSSLFEGFGDDAITSLGSFDTQTPTAVILYDLFPLTNPDAHFLTNKIQQDYYHRKIASLKRARLLLAISESTRQEALTALRFDGDSVVNISGACDDAFRPLHLTADEKDAVCRRVGISKSFVLYTGGADKRKNLHRLIQAYARLPEDVRKRFQLVFAGMMPPDHIDTFSQIAGEHGLDRNQLVVAGYVEDDDLLVLYNACALFVFPSTHEGFGIPPLEAMSCGAPVIGADATSLTEVIGLPEALFDPTSVESISAKLYQALTDEAFRKRLVTHGLTHSKKFTWEASARRAIAALQRFDRPSASRGSHRVNVEKTTLFGREKKKILLLKLDHLGDFMLAIPALTRLKARYPYADIDIVVGSWCAPIAQSLGLFNKIHTFDFFKEKSSVSAAATARDTEMLLSQLAPNYDIAIDLRRQRDTRFLLAEISATTKVGYETFDPSIDARIDIVLPSHPDALFEVTPLNETSISLQVLRLIDALPSSPNDYVYFPVLSDKATPANTAIAVFPKAGNDVKEWSQQNYRGLIALVLDDPAVDAVNVYFANDREAESFGLAAHAKLHVHAGLDFPALTSSLADNVICIANNSFGAHIGSYLGLLVIAIYGGQETVAEWAPAFNTGYVIHHPVPCSPCHIAHVSDCPYALRCLTEISVATVFSKVQEALAAIAANRAAGKRANAVNLTENKGPGTLVQELIRSIADLDVSTLGANDKLLIAEGIAANHPASGPRNLFVDVSELVLFDARSGIQRVVRSVLRVMLERPPAGYAVVPVYATVDQPGYRKAARFTRSFSGNSVEQGLTDEPILYAAGDIFLGLDLHPHVVRAQRQVFRHMRSRGVRVLFVVYDLLCASMPQHFVPGSEEPFADWLQVVAENDGAICISTAVANELRDWIRQHGPLPTRSFDISHFHLGADIKSALPGAGLSASEQQLLRRLSGHNNFLMVGTLEPRKGHAQAVAAFEQLWKDGVDANLIIVGKKGWLVDDLVQRLRNHAEAGKRLFWVEGASDELLEQIYAASDCLLNPSEGEGFGLPLIEAAHHKLPIIARDLPVFREVAGDHAYYFSGQDPKVLASVIRDWLELRRSGRHPDSAGMPWLTWEQSTGQLIAAVCG